MRSIAVDKATDILLALLSPIATVGCLIAYLAIAAVSRIRRTDSTPSREKGRSLLGRYAIYPRAFELPYEPRLTSFVEF